MLHRNSRAHRIGRSSYATSFDRTTRRRPDMRPKPGPIPLSFSAFRGCCQSIGRWLASCALVSVPTMGRALPRSKGQAMSRAKPITTLAVALAVAAGLSPTAAGTANAANNGRAYCVDGEEVVGVWVTVQGGKSGWAARGGQGSSQSWSYSTQGKSYKLTVGCGGSPQSWRESTSTPGFENNWQVVNCWPGPAERYGDGGHEAPIGLCLRA
jgi:hypothetical protein